MRNRVLLLVLFGSCFAASAQLPSVSQGNTAPAVDAAHQATPEQLREYFALIKLSDSMRSMMTQTVGAMKSTSAPFIPDVVWQDMSSSMASYDFLSELIPIYQKHLTRADLAGVLAFYRSPPGVHLLANQAPMTTEAQVVFRAIGSRIGAQVVSRHQEEIAAAKAKYESDIANRQNQNSTPKP